MNTLFVGQNHIHLTNTDSTNNHALRLLSEGDLAEGTVISTDDQSDGRGQRGNSWLMKPFKNLALSIILKPSFISTGEQFMLSKVISLATAETIKQCLIDNNADIMVKIKWPNDIIVNNKKIAGILIENTINGNNIKYSIAGIGINVNAKIEIENTTSMIEVLNTEIDLQHLIKTLCSFIEKYYLLLRSSPEQISREYITQLYRLKEEHHFIINNIKTKGIIEGVAFDGKLLLKINDQLSAFDLKEIQFIY